MQKTDMNKIVGSHHILFICLDTLRYDVAYREQETGGIPVLNRYGKWRKCQAPGNFTYPSHQAMFAGFLPVDEEIRDMKQREKLFFSEDIGMGRKAPEGAFNFKGPNIIKGLENEGYDTYCIGGVSFFDKRTDIGKVMPGYFRHSYWNPSFGCKVKESAAHQVDFALRKLQQVPDGRKIMMYINISALHYPNYFYVPGERQDSIETQAAALRYVDGELDRLFAAFSKKGNTFVICCSDHGTCYGEDGVLYHGINHPIVNTVPYKHFVLEGDVGSMRDHIIQGKGVWKMQIDDPYIQYMYSYPHKTSYRQLEEIDLKSFFDCLAGQENSLYFHIPFCQYKCGYCNLFSLAGQPKSIMQRYVDAMERQAEQMSRALPAEAEFSDLTFGGGTPLILSEQMLERVFRISGEYFNFRPGTNPVIVETSPNQTTKEKLWLLKEHGTTRLSIGVQSFQEKELEALYRFHGAETAKRALKDIGEVGFSCVNIDLIYGIPGQTKESLLDSLEQALDFSPEELFIYPLYVKPGTTLYLQGAKRQPETFEMYQCLREKLEKEGYHPYSMRRFVKAEAKETETSLCGFGNTVSVGCGGRSYIGNLHFCTPYAVRQEHCISLVENYIQKKDYMNVEFGCLLSADEQKRRYVIKHILFGQGISRRDYRQHFGGEAEQDFEPIAKWLNEGYAVRTADHIALTKEGIALSDYLGPQLISDEVLEKMKGWRETGV